ncbi:MAG: hypothetical protein II813_09985 [Spirochaetales bacterium]|nr:hypothetical protein [Spirochaetales bacterium]
MRIENLPTEIEPKIEKMPTEIGAKIENMPTEIRVKIEKMPIKIGFRDLLLLKNDFSVFDFSRNIKAFFPVLIREIQLGFKSLP